MADEAQSILAPAQIDNTAKANAWQAFKDSANEREFGAKLQTMDLPQQVKADLWEAKRRSGITARPTEAQQVQAGLPQPMAVIPSGLLPNSPQEAEQEEAKSMAESGAGPAAAYMKPQRTAKAVGGMLLAGNAVGAPIATAGGLVGSYAGGKAARYGAKQLGAGETGQNIAEIGGNLIGATLGAGTGGSISAPITQWITSSRTTGARLLQEASVKAGNAPVELSPRTNELVDDLVQHSKLGGKPIKVINDLLERLGPSTKIPAEAPPNPLTYNEARILQSNMSQLSTEEAMGLKGAQKGLLKQLANSFSKDVQDAADKAGVGTEHAAGMREYAIASARGRTLEKAAKVAGIGAGGLGAWEAAKAALKAVQR